MSLVESAIRKLSIALAPAAGSRPVLRHLLSAIVLMACGATTASTHEMEVSSPTFRDGEVVPRLHLMNRYGCLGENRSPAVSWSNVPPGTRSFAVTLYDPDATTGSGWWHWIVYDIPASTRSLTAGLEQGIGRGLPGRAAQASNDFGDRGYGGPCPPRGERPHRYVLTVHALRVETLAVPHQASPAFVRYRIWGNRIGAGSIAAKFGH
jgi:Raf kinase inhibitor-like YbhB/YbcL family protein